MTIPHPVTDADACIDIVLLWQLLGYERRRSGPPVRSPPLPHPKKTGRIQVPTQLQPFPVCKMAKTGRRQPFRCKFNDRHDRNRAVAAEDFDSTPPSLSQFVEQRLCLFEIGRVEAFGEPAIDRGEEVAGFGGRSWSRRSRARLAAARNTQSLAPCSAAMLKALRYSSTAAS